MEQQTTRDNERIQQELSVIKQYGLRWAVLASWKQDLVERKTGVPQDVGNKMEMARVKIASGCFCSCEVQHDLSEVEAILISSDGSSPNSKADYWMELLGQAMSDPESAEKLLRIPAVKSLVTNCNLSCSCWGQ